MNDNEPVFDSPDLSVKIIYTDRSRATYAKNVTIGPAFEAMDRMIWGAVLTPGKVKQIVMVDGNDDVLVEWSAKDQAFTHPPQMSGERWPWGRRRRRCT